MDGRSVAGIARRDGLVLVGRRKPGGELGGKWEFPGGKVEPGESAEDALRREYLEELGVPVAVGERLGSSEFSTRGRRFGLEAWAVTLEGPVAIHPEHDELRWVEPAALASLDLAESDRTLLPFVG